MFSNRGFPLKLVCVHPEIADFGNLYLEKNSIFNFEKIALFAAYKSAWFFNN
jgi:hypothetical protein